MKGKIDELCIIFVLGFIIFSIVFYAYNSSEENTEVFMVTPSITVTPTVTNTSTPTPTNTPTSVSTVTPSPTPSPTVIPRPTPTPMSTLLEGIPDQIIEEALMGAKEQLELFSSDEVTLYNTYSEKELELLFRVVEAEATDYCIECKSHVASVIFNRLKAGWWGGDLAKSLMAKNQFEVITNGRYKKITITEETILACEIAFARDTAQGALFFDSTKGKSWAHRNRTFIFSDGAHWFYK